MGSIENWQFCHQQRECALHNKKSTVQQSKGAIRKLFLCTTIGWIVVLVSWFWKKIINNKQKWANCRDGNPHQFCTVWNFQKYLWVFPQVLEGFFHRYFLKFAKVLVEKPLKYLREKPENIYRLTRATKPTRFQNKFSTWIWTWVPVLDKSFGDIWGEIPLPQYVGS